MSLEIRALTENPRTERRGNATPVTIPFMVALVVFVLLPIAAQAQAIPHRGYWGPGLSTEDKQLLLESVARLNGAVPIKIGSSESWSNPQTNNSGRSSIRRVFRSGARICHLVRHRIVVAGRRARNYSLTWCHTPGGEWEIKS